METYKILILEIYANSPYTFGILVFSLLLAGAFSFMLYWKSGQNSPLSERQVYSLSALRFISVFLLSVLFLQLAVKYLKHRSYQPALIIGIDNSESLSPFQQDVLSLKNYLKQELNAYSPEVILFDNEVIREVEPTFTGKRSDYSKLFDEIDQSYLSSDVGALVLLGDGIFNSGTDPAFISETVNYPIYAIGFGDTTIHTDAAIRKVIHNSRVFLDSPFAAEIDLSFTKAAGQLVNLTVEESGKIIYSRAIRIESDHYFITENISLKPTNEGITNYSVKLETVTGEQNLANNSFDFSVNVVSEKQHILILTHGPHPDVGALMKTLENEAKYEIELIHNPKSELDFSHSDLVVVHQLPDQTSESVSLLQKLLASGRPVLFILGQETAIASFNELQTGLEFLQGNSFEQATPLLREDFSLFHFDVSELQVLESFPPLQVPFGDANLHTGMEVLANQTIQTIETNRPLMAFGRVNGKKRGFIAGEGLWRWRIHNYLKNGSHQNFDSWIQKAIYYLVLKNNEDNFNLFYETEYAEDVPVILQAELFNESFELDNSPDISIQFTAKNGQQYEAVFDKAGEKYQLNMGRLPVGEYEFSARTVLGEKTYEESGSFTVSRIQIELVDTEANFQSLAQMARKSGGNFYLAEQVDQFIEQLNEQSNLKSNQLEQQIYRELLSVRWIFFVLLFLLALEWFLRKFWGIY